MMPWALSATSVLYNLPGVKNNLHLSGKVIADMYLGKITKWNDARIAKLNKGVSPAGHGRSRRSTAATARARRSTSPSS